MLIQRFICAVYLLAAGVFTPLDVVASSEDTAIAGVVIDSRGYPVDGALIVVTPGNAIAETGGDGAFLIEGHTPGTYRLHISAPSSAYDDVYLQVSLPDSAARSLKIIMRERTYRADEIVVMTSKRYGALGKSDASAYVTIVERSDFGDKALTVADVVAATPGANLTTTGGLGSFTEVSLRGAYSNQVQVYVDGMLLNEAVGGAVNLGTIPLTGVESVEVWRSGAPARFGGDSPGGAVNIRTRDIVQASNTLTAGYGSFGTYTGGVVMSLPMKTSRFMLSADFAASANDFKYKSDNGTTDNPDDDYIARRSNDEYRSASVLAKYSRVFGGGTLLELSEHLIGNTKNIPALQHIRYSHASLGTTKNLFQGRMTWRTGEDMHFEAAPAVQHISTREHYEDKEGLVGWGKEDSVYDTRSMALLTPLMAGYREIVTISATPVLRRETFRPDNRIDKTVPLSCDRNQAGVVGDLALSTPGKRIVLTANVRRDSYRSSFEGETNTFVPVSPGSTRHLFTNSTAGIRLGLLSWLSMQANYADTWREPGFYELFGDRGRTLSKPGLVPERIFRRDAGVRISYTGENAAAGGFLEFVRFENTCRNLIQWYSNNYGFNEPVNVGGAYVKGYEIVWRGDWYGRANLSGNWTLQESEVTATRKVYHLGKELPNRPGRYGGMTLNMPFAEHAFFWTVDYKDSYYLDRANQLHRLYPGRTLHDLGVRACIRPETLSFNLLAKNVTDEQTFDIQGMPKPGRSFMVTVAYQLR